MVGGWLSQARRAEGVGRTRGPGVPTGDDAQASLRSLDESDFVGEWRDRGTHADQA